MTSHEPSSCVDSYHLPVRHGAILLVDEDLHGVTTLSQALAEYGYQVQPCTSGAQALAHLRQTAYDTVLCELVMPHMDGLMLLRAGLEIDPHLMSIVLTSHGAIETAVEALQSGAFDYIEKPPRLSILLPLVDRARQVRRRRQAQIQEHQVEAVYELSMVLASLEAGLLLRRIVDTALQVSHADEASLVLATPEGTEGLIAAVADNERSHLVGSRVPFDQSIIGWVARSQEALALQGTIVDSRFRPVQPRAEIHSALSVPLVTGGHLVGVLNVNATKRLRGFTSGDLKAVRLLAHSVAPAVLTTP